MRLSIWLVMGAAVVLSGCMTAEQQRAADEDRCRSYGFTKRNDAFAECMQRLDLARRARNRGGPYVDDFSRPIVFIQ